MPWAAARGWEFPSVVAGSKWVVPPGWIGPIRVPPTPVPCGPIVLPRIGPRARIFASRSVRGMSLGVARIGRQGRRGMLVPSSFFSRSRQGCRPGPLERKAGVSRTRKASRVDAQLCRSSPDERQGSMLAFWHGPFRRKALLSSTSGWSRRSGSDPCRRR